MSDKPKVFVAGIGMITAVGATSQMTAASVKAGINRYQNSDVINKRLNHFKMASIPVDGLAPLEESLSTVGLTARQRRMLRVATPALNEALEKYSHDQPIPLFLAVPEQLPANVSAISSKFISYLQKQTGAKLDLNSSRLLATGRAGGIQAIDIAFQYFASTNLDYALVGGVVSWYDLNLLSQLDEDSRMSDEGKFDTFVPGEGAGFLLLISEKAASQQNNLKLPSIYQPGLGIEEGHRYSDSTYTGDGLATSFRQAIANAVGSPVNAIYSSLNGENFGSKEFGVASMRNSASMSPDVNHAHPADCFGDIGAAFAPVLIGLIALSKINGSQLAYCSSESGYRGAVCINA